MKQYLKWGGIALGALVVLIIIVTAVSGTTKTKTVFITVTPTPTADSAIEPSPTGEPVVAASSAAPVSTDATWVKVAEMTTTSSSKKGNLFAVSGEKQKIVIHYTAGEYGAGATAYIYLKGDSSSDGYTETAGAEKNGTESSMMYVDPGDYYLNLCVFGGKATATVYDFR
jgi:hypothetical protein